MVLFGVLGVVLLVYFLYDGRNQKRFQWNESYTTASDQPYGLLFIKKLLEGYRPGQPFIFNDKTPLHTLLRDSTVINRPTDYVFIGRTLYLDTADASALLRFIYDGNDAFVASAFLPYELVDAIYVSECDTEIFLPDTRLESVTMNFYNPALTQKKGYVFAYRQGKIDYEYPWRSLNGENFCDSLTAMIPLGFQDPDRVNFVKMPYGKGNLYIHTNPLAFTNYFISQPDKPAYAAGVFSHLGGEAILWDDFSKARFGNDTPEAYTNPLSYFLQQPSLKYAWWMMLACAILYTLFTAKRRQRVIPVIEPKVNTSLEYAKMVSALHFQNGNHMDIARKKMKYFLYFIRAKYGIYAQQFTEEHMKRLAEKSTIDIQDIQLIFNEYHQIESITYNNPASDRLVRLYSAIDQFYKHCK